MRCKVLCIDACFSKGLMVILASKTFLAFAVHWLLRAYSKLYLGEKLGYSFIISEDTTVSANVAFYWTVKFANLL